MIGQMVEHYRIESKLGEGGMGTVYRALDGKLNRVVAIKFLSENVADAASRRRFQREAQMASSLNHPHIVTVHDAGEFEGLQYLVTEFVDGGTLRDWARDTRSPAEIVELLVGVADGLAAAHEAGILHRDIKPANILVSRNGYAKLADFGLAKLEEPDAATRTITEGCTVQGAIVGSIPYMSPEQASGKPLDARSDIFSFGTAMYELLAGHRPFRGATDLQVLQTIVHASPEPMGEGVPAPLRAVVEKALAKDPGERYQSMREMAADLRRFLRSGETAAIAKRTWRRLPLWAAAVMLAAAVILVAAVAAAWKWWPRAGAQQIRSIAVLPLRNLSSDPNQDYFSDGITEALISNLAQIRSLKKVISRTSVMHYKGTTKLLPDIGRELGADAIVEGSLQRVGNRVRISAQLILAATDAHLWAKDYEREIADVLRLEAEVAQEIAREIRAQVTPEEAKRLSGVRSVKPAAREEYLLGRHYFWQGNPASRKMAIEHFEKAVQLQPDYAAAYAGLAIAWHLLEAVGAARPNEAQPGARRAALKALELDPNLAEAHVAMAGVHWFEEWDWAEAEKEYRRAGELNPDSLELCACNIVFLYTTGRMSEAIALGERAVSVDPLGAFVHTVYGRALYAARRYPEAVTVLQTALKLNPQGRGASTYLAKTYEQTGKLQEALATVDRPEFRPSPELALAYALLGRRAEASQMLRDISGPGVDPYGISLVCFALGDRDAGFSWLTRAFDQRQVFVSFAAFDPGFDGVRSDTRFQALIARLRLPKT